jgi:peroxiredoxin family protein
VFPVQGDPGYADRVSVTHEGATIAIFLHSGAYDRVHQGLSIAASGLALSRRVEVYFFWWALDRLLSDRLDEVDFPERADVAERFEARGLPTLRELLAHIRGSGQAVLVACSGSLAALGRTQAEAAGRVDLVLGWSSILQRTAGVVDRFYL